MDADARRSLDAFLLQQASRFATSLSRIDQRARLRSETASRKRQKRGRSMTAVDLALLEALDDDDF